MDGLGCKGIVHFFFLKAKLQASKEDNPNWYKAMKIPSMVEYLESSEKHIQTLEGKNAWDIVQNEFDVIVINKAWDLHTNNSHMEQ